MRFFNRIINFIHFKFLSFIRPERIALSNAEGNLINGTGSSNMTHISSRNNNLKIGKNVFIGHFNYIDAFNAKLIIENNVEITNFVSILTHSTHNTIRFENFKEHKALRQEGEVSIGSWSYIGPHTVIMPNTKIGICCIISAYSYVKGNIPDYSIVRGRPGKIIGDTRNLDSKLIKEHPELYQSIQNDRIKDNN